MIDEFDVNRISIEIESSYQACKKFKMGKKNNKILENKKTCPICLVIESSENNHQELCDYCEDLFHFDCGGIRLSGKKYYENLKYVCPFCITFFIHNIKLHPDYLTQTKNEISECIQEPKNSILKMPPLEEFTEEIKKQEREKLFHSLEKNSLIFKDDLVYDSTELKNINNRKYETIVQVQPIIIKDYLKI